MDDYNNSGVYIGSKDNLINGSRWYNDGENSQGHLRCFNVMMERDCYLDQQRKENNDVV